MSIALKVRRTVRAPARRVFEAWTDPKQLEAWWGPRPVVCTDAQVDLRVGGRYRIVNALPDGSTVVIEGEFKEVSAPHRLVYTWNVSAFELERSLVTVRFEDRGDSTEVVVVHEHIPSARVRDSHRDGWNGCLDGLEKLFTPRPEGP